MLLGDRVVRLGVVEHARRHEKLAVERQKRVERVLERIQDAIALGVHLVALLLDELLSGLEAIEPVATNHLDGLLLALLRLAARVGLELLRSGRDAREGFLARLCDLLDDARLLLRVLLEEFDQSIFRCLKVRRRYVGVPGFAGLLLVDAQVLQLLQLLVEVVLLLLQRATALLIRTADRLDDPGRTGFAAEEPVEREKVPRGVRRPRGVEDAERTESAESWSEPAFDCCSERDRTNATDCLPAAGFKGFLRARKDEW